MWRGVWVTGSRVGNPPREEGGFPGGSDSKESACSAGDPA